MQACAELFRVLSHDWARKPSTKVARYAARLQAAWNAFVRAREAGGS